MALKHSKQREAIWEFLSDRTDHPTADTVYEGVRKDLPNISLGTVYRNLLLLRDLGKVRTVEVGDGIVHFDPNVSEHYHFICKECGKVSDIHGMDDGNIKMIAASKFDGLIEGYSAYFTGLCRECLETKNRVVAAQAGQ